MSLVDTILAHHTSAEAAMLMDELCDAYADAYGAISVEDTHDKTSAFRDRATGALQAVNYALVTARFGGQLVGFSFGYSLRPDTSWWDGLLPEPSSEFSIESGSRTFVLSEIEVRRSWQARSLGRRIHDALLGERSEERATLATGPDHTSQSIYERWGWRKVGRVPGSSNDYFAAYDLFVLPLPLIPRL